MARKKQDEDQPEDDADDAEPGTSSNPAQFTASEAMEIAVAGDRLRREIALLIRREEKHAEIVAKCREDRKTKTQELIGLWEDKRSGQTRLDFKDGEGKKEPLPAKDAGEGPGRFVMKHGDKKLSVTRQAPGSWTASIDGRLVGDGLEDATSAMHFLLADLGVEKQLWSSMVWSTEDDFLADAAGEADPSERLTAEVLIGKETVALAVLRIGKQWFVEIAGARQGGAYHTKAAAQRACVKELEGGNAGEDVPKIEWAKPAGDPPAFDPLAEIWVAKVGRKSAEVRQDSPGKWTGRIGGSPIAIDLPLDDAKRLCAEELTKGKNDGATVDWKQK